MTQLKRDQVSGADGATKHVVLSEAEERHVFTHSIAPGVISAVYYLPF
ncbi:MAG: hypothetical protein V1903_02500 [Bacteroidota bacterium]